MGFSNLGVVLVMTLKFYAIVAKGSKLKFKTFRGLSRTSIEVTREKLVGALFAPAPPSFHIPYRVKDESGVVKVSG